MYQTKGVHRECSFVLVYLPTLALLLLVFRLDRAGHWQQGIHLQQSQPEREVQITKMQICFLLLIIRDLIPLLVIPCKHHSCQWLCQTCCRDHSRTGLFGWQCCNKKAVTGKSLFSSFVINMRIYFTSAQ